MTKTNSTIFNAKQVCCNSHKSQVLQADSAWLEWFSIQNFCVYAGQIYGTESAFNNIMKFLYSYRNKYLMETLTSMK